MKILIFFITLLFFTNTFAQEVDWVNAPINPTGLRYKLEHFNLKGPISKYDDKTFNEDGLLIKEYKTTLNYVNGKLTSDSKGRTFKLNSNGHVTSITTKSGYVGTYKYNSSGLLTHDSDYSNVKAKYKYDELGRLIKDMDESYNYKTDGSLVRVTSKRYLSPGEVDWTEYLNGNKVKSHSMYGLESTEYEFDNYGNVKRIVLTNLEDNEEKVWKYSIIYFNNNEIQETIIEDEIIEVEEVEIEEFVIEDTEEVKTVNKDGSLQSIGHINNSRERVGLWKFYTDNNKGNKLSFTVNFNSMIMEKMTEGRVYSRGKVTPELYEIGLWKEYHENGELKSIGEYNGTYYYGTETGIWKKYYDNGKLESEFSYNKDGVSIGEWKWYYKNGKIRSIRNYDSDGNQINDTSFNEDGTIFKN